MLDTTYIIENIHIAHGVLIVQKLIAQPIFPAHFLELHSECSTVLNPEHFAVSSSPDSNPAVFKCAASHFLRALHIIDVSDKS